MPLPVRDHVVHAGTVQRCSAGPAAVNAVVRAATVADAARIAAVHVEAWREAYRGMLPEPFLADLSVADRERRWRASLTEGTSSGTTLVATIGRDVVGFAYAGPSRDPDAGALAGELDSLYIAPERWRQGIGSLLQGAALAGLAGAGFTSATLWVLSANQPARAFYERTGWTADGTDKTERRGDVALHQVRYRRKLDR